MGALTFAVAACAPPSDSLYAGADLARQDVLAVGYDRLADFYVERVDLGRLSLAGLNALDRFDPSIRAVSDGEIVVIRQGGDTVGQFDAPGPERAAAWARVVDDAVTTLIGTSARLRGTDREALVDTLMTGITGGLDAYSYYHDPARSRSERATRDGYAGIGVTFTRTDDDAVEISDVLTDSPAKVAGILTGDRIVSVDGFPVARMASDDELRNRVTGPPGTRVTIGIERNGEPWRNVVIQREHLVPNMVVARREGDLGVVSIRRFNVATARHLAEALDDLNRRAPEAVSGWIIDLRGNPGGLLDQAVDVADLLMSRGEIIRTVGRHPDSRQHYRSDRRDLTEGAPLVVLVDGRSASAAEILAAALQDSGRAVVVGTSSLGKGSVQTVTRLPNDGELFLTWSRIYTASGLSFHEVGVKPMLCTSDTASGVDTVLASIDDMGPAELTELRREARTDEEARAALDAYCPQGIHRYAPEDAADDIDLAVARALIADQGLFRQALSAQRMIALNRGDGP